MNVVPLRKPVTLGSSEIPAVLGLDPFVSPYALACRKLGVTSEPEPSDAARLGLILQLAHLDALRSDGYDVREAADVELTHPELDWMVGHPDGVLVRPDEVIPVELKARGVAPTEQLRMRDTVQALIYAELAESSQALVSELCGGYGGFHREEWLVDRDADVFTSIVAACEAFLATVARGKAPKPDGSESAREALRARYGGIVGLAHTLSEAGMESLRKFREWDYTEKQAKGRKEAYAQLVQDEMGDATVALSPAGLEVARFGVVSSTRTDTKRLARDHPDLTAEYQTTTTYRRFEAL